MREKHKREGRKREIKTKGELRTLANASLYGASATVSGSPQQTRPAVNDRRVAALATHAAAAAVRAE